jgi:hypothetical protein
MISLVDYYTYIHGKTRLAMIKMKAPALALMHVTNRPSDETLISTAHGIAVFRASRLGRIC